MSFLVGFILAWLLCRRYTHISIAQECERLGGFFVGNKTYTCIAIHNRDSDASVPQVILDAQKNEVNDAT